MKNRQWICENCGSIYRLKDDWQAPHAPEYYGWAHESKICCDTKVRALTHEQGYVATHLDNEKRLKWYNLGGYILRKKQRGKDKWTAAFSEREINDAIDQESSHRPSAFLSWNGRNISLKGSALNKSDAAYAEMLDIIMEVSTPFVIDVIRKDEILPSLEQDYVFQYFDHIFEIRLFELEEFRLEVFSRIESCNKSGDSDFARMLFKWFSDRGYSVASEQKEFQNLRILIQEKQDRLEANHISLKRKLEWRFGFDFYDFNNRSLKKWIEQVFFDSHATLLDAIRKEFFYACKCGDLNAVKKIAGEIKGLTVGNLDEKVSALERMINRPSVVSWLQYVACKGHLDIVKYLVEDCRVGKDGALNWAAEWGRLDVVKYLVENYGVDAGAATVELLDTGKATKELLASASRSSNYSTFKYIVDKLNAKHVMLSPQERFSLYTGIARAFEANIQDVPPEERIENLQKGLYDKQLEKMVKSNLWRSQNEIQDILQKVKPVIAVLLQ